jgi:hypothetical protein
MEEQAFSGSKNLAFSLSHDILVREAAAINAQCDNLECSGDLSIIDVIPVMT